MPQSVYAAMCVVFKTVDTAQHSWYCSSCFYLEIRAEWAPAGQLIPRGCLAMQPLKFKKLLRHSKNIQNNQHCECHLSSLFSVTHFICFFLLLLFVAGDPIIPPVSGGVAAAPHMAQWAKRQQQEEKKRLQRGITHSFHYSKDSLVEETELCYVLLRRENKVWSFAHRGLCPPRPPAPSPPILSPTTTQCWIWQTFFKLCSSALFYGFIVFSTLAAENDWDPDPSLKNTCYEILQN